MKSATIVTAFALLAIACTTTTTTTTPEPTTDKKATEPDGTKADAGTKDPPASTSSSSGSTSGEPAAPSCADETGQQACAQCCAADHQAGATVYMDAVKECMCEAANCATECADTLCAATAANPDAACNTCFQSKQGDCGSALTTACGANTDCVAFNQCLTDSGCGTKK